MMLALQALPPLISPPVSRFPRSQTHPPPALVFTHNRRGPLGHSLRRGNALVPVLRASPTPDPQPKNAKSAGKSVKGSNFGDEPNEENEDGDDDEQDDKGQNDDDKDDQPQPAPTPPPPTPRPPQTLQQQQPKPNADDKRHDDDKRDHDDKGDHDDKSHNDDKGDHDDKSTDKDDQPQPPPTPPPTPRPPQTLQQQQQPKSDAGEEEKKSNANSKLYLAGVFGLWYAQNVIFNIYNKKVLNLFPYPWLLASFQLFVGSLWMGFLWASGLQPFPKVSKKFFVALLGPALFHTIGHISACVSFSKVAVSFTHVIKASEPVFSVIFSALHGQFYPIHVWLSVLPIVFGCSLAAVTEVSFNAQGLWGALISNVGFVLRNIYSKQSLYDFKHINGLNLYGWISIISLLYLFPVAVLVEGKQWVGGLERAIMMSSSPWTFYSWVLLSGVFYHLYNQSSFQALDKISPLTFSVGNTMKRVVVIVASLLVFRNPIIPLNALGSAIAVFGTFLYSQATTMGKKQKAKTS